MKSIEHPPSHVATSCVEAGVDFSFRYAFRDLFAPVCACLCSGRQASRAGQCPAQAGSWGLVNLLQINGWPAGIGNRKLQISNPHSATGGAQAAF